jgi:hypothetical protein
MPIRWLLPDRRTHPEMANLPDIFVAQKILSSEYQPYTSGKIFRAPQSRTNLPIFEWHDSGKI